ncbi:MAG: hypothetical protein ACE5DQ_00525 [Candidatus Paceibacterota bacterium]
MGKNKVYANFMRSSFATVVFILVIIALAVVLVQQRAQRATQESISKASSAQVEPADNLPATIALSFVKDTGGAGREVSVIATIDSGGEAVTGFDAMIHYDHSALKIQEVHGSLPGFDYFDTDEQIGPSTSELIITAIRSLDNEEKVILADQEVVKIVVTPLKREGETTLDLVFEAGNRRFSQVINIDSQNILGSAESLVVDLETL